MISSVSAMYAASGWTDDRLIRCLLLLALVVAVTSRWLDDRLTRWLLLLLAALDLDWA